MVKWFHIKTRLLFGLCLAVMFSCKKESKTAAAQSQTLNLDQYMEPFWSSDTIYNETILLYSKEGQPANGNLLYQPDKILGVKSFDLTTDFKQGKDYDIAGNMLTRRDSSAMPFRADTSFSAGDGVWFNIQGQFVMVTYTHHDQWTGVVPAYLGDNMPNTIAKLKAKAPLTIVAYGMSITAGFDVSGYDKIPPYMPTYMDLFAMQLKKAYGDNNIKLINNGVPGKTIEWGAQNTGQYVNSLKPDLVTVDFGMNDFWSDTPDQFKGYAQTIISSIQSANPNAEIILVSNMKFDPAYIALSDPSRSLYLANMIAYNKVFQSLQTKGVIDFDMTDISDMLYTKKKPKDCISNPLHPNDYQARWYAQGLSALLIKN